jgi:hypothetical protein
VFPRIQRMASATGYKSRALPGASGKSERRFRAAGKRRILSLLFSGHPFAWLRALNRAGARGLGLETPKETPWPKTKTRNKKARIPNPKAKTNRKVKKT